MPSRSRAWLRSHWLLLALMALGAAAAVAVRHGVFPYYSIDRDEPVYVLQAKTLLGGHLTLPRYPDFEFFQPWLTGVRGDRVFFEFPPGYPALLAVSLLFTGSIVPALAVVAAFTVLAMYLLAREASGSRGIALVAAAMTVATPMVLIQSGLFLSYLFTLCLGLFAGWLLLRGTRTGRTRDLVFAGVFLGAIFLTRPFDALLWGIPFVVYLVVVTVRGRRGAGEAVRRVAWVAAGFVPLALVMAAYNARITGSPTTFPIEAADPLNTFGFGIKRLMIGAPEIEFTKQDSFDAIGQNYRYAPGFVFGGFVGIALALGGIYFARRRGATYVLLGIVATFTFGYFFYWGISLMATGAPLFGPQYYLPMLAPVAVLGATTVVVIWRWKPIAALLCLVVLAVISEHYFSEHVHQNRMSSALWYERQHDAIERFDGTNAVVFVPTEDPFLMTDLAFAFNDPELSGDQLYAVDRGPENAEFIARSDRTPYRLVNLFRQSAVEASRASTTDVRRLRLVRTPTMTFRARITNVSDSPVVTAFLDTGGGPDEVVLDTASRRGAMYDVEWTIAAPDHGGDGITTLAPGAHWVVVGTRFDGNAEERQQFEYRYATSARRDELLVVVPPRRVELAFTPYGRILSEAPPSPALAVTRSP